MFIEPDTLKWINLNAISAKHPYKGRSKVDVQTAVELGLVWQDEPQPPEGYSPDTHTREETADRMPPYITYPPKPPEQVEAARIAKIDAGILALEKDAIEQGLIRTLIDDLLIRAQEIAAAHNPPVTEAQLLDPESEYFSRSYQKAHANAVARAALRAQR